MEGLARLEYRGYDSAGVALICGEDVVTTKRAGKLANLISALAEAPLPESSTAIGHTRWATHGAPTNQNAHPHRGGEDGKLALIHNGIIENFHGLRSALIDDGVTFLSETDTEVVAQLLARSYDKVGDLTEAMRQVVGDLKGAFTLLAVHADEPGAVSYTHLTLPTIYSV